MKATARYAEETIRSAASITFATVAVLYKSAHCPKCSRRLMDIPGNPQLDIRIVGDRHPSGEGRTLRCQRCKTTLEIIEHHG